MSTKRSETRGNSGGSAAAGSGVLSAVPRGIVAPLHSRGSWPLLWLAFGALTVLLIIVGVVSVRGLRAIAVDVDLQADVARPRSDAARELELNVLDYGLGVRTYVAGDAESRERANGDARGVADSLAKYEQLVETPQQRELATRFTDHWQSFHTFGETLMAAGTASPQELMRLASLRLAVVKVLDDEMQPDAVAALDARRAATQTTLENTEAVTLLLLIGGVLLALVTSGVVVRAVVRSEIALRDSEERLKLATAVSGIGIWDWNLATDTLVWDDALLAMYGARREDFSGTHEAWTTRLHPDDKAASDAAIEDALSGKKAFATEFRVIWPDGSVHHLKASGQVIRDEVGKPLRMVGTNLDVTERELRDRNRFFLADIQKVFAPLATESDLVRIACGRIAEHLELVHCSVVEVRAEADQCTVLHDCHAPGTPNLAGDYRLSDFHSAHERQALGAGETLVLGDVRADERDPAKVAQFEALGIRAMVNAGVVAQGQWRFVLHVSRGMPTAWTPQDVALITELATRLFVRIERARAEEQVRASDAALKTSDRHKDEFLATLAHELRNPLAPLRNAVAVLQAKGPATPELQYAREVIDRQSKALARLIDDLMDVSRINQGKLELKREHVELAKIVEGAIESSRPLIDEMGHALAVTVPALPVVVDADLIRLAQVFLNLLNNAAKYTKRGGRIDLHVELQGSDVVVSVTDTGIGIPADKLPTIFALFSQVEGALSRSNGGLGIGLNVAKRLVQMHGGTIQARSGGSGTGSEFVVRLPIVVAQTEPRQASGDAAIATPPADLRILVVDDNLDAAESLAMLLEMMGNKVHMAHDGEEAVAAAQEFRPQVVLCDIGLPKLNGYEACRQIRAQPWAKKAILIAVTGWGQPDDRRRSAEAGFDHHMVKPVDPQALMTLLASQIPVKG